MYTLIYTATGIWFLCSFIGAFRYVYLKESTFDMPKIYSTPFLLTSCIGIFFSIILILCLICKYLP